VTRAEKPLEPGLYVAATPIGNLGDVTFRVVEALKGADRILCEDTRQTAKLLAAYDVKTPMSPYHDHNADRVRPGIIDALKEGARFVLVSDAGTPLISDPGAKLVRAARAAGVAVFPLPGPSAFVAALSAAEIPRRGNGPSSRDFRRRKPRRAGISSPSSPGFPPALCFMKARSGWR
jgi:16S rRNA (cytidine1402-2'-O)-methyltransferase